MADLRVNARVSLSDTELTVRFSRSGGPGGQSVNTSDTKAEVSFDLLNSPSVPDFLKVRASDRLAKQLVNGVLTVVSSEQRSQFQNRVAAQRRLIEILVEAFAPPPPPRRPTKPTRGSQQRRLQDKSARGQVKRGRGRPSTDE